MRLLLAALGRDRRGAALVEFALLIGIVLTMIMGLADVCYQAYLQAVLDGAVQQAGRDASIEGGESKAGTLDDDVTKRVKAIAGGASLTFSRKNYATFSQAAPERFDDNIKKNGVRDPGECYDDVNNNSRWDADPGEDGQGGANDINRYVVNVTYQRLFPLAGLLGWSNDVTLTAQTLLRNQPYAKQLTRTMTTRCSP